MSCISAVLVTCVVLANGSVQVSPMVLSKPAAPPAIPGLGEPRYRVSAYVAPDTSSLPFVQERAAWNLGDAYRYQYVPESWRDLLRYHTVGVSVGDSGLTGRFQVKRGGAGFSISRSW